MRIVLDANIYVSASISTLGNPGRIIAQWQAEKFEVLITPAILDEVGRVLRYPRIMKRHKQDEKSIHRYLKLLASQATFVEVKEKLGVVTEDESDNRYIECAVDGKADYIVTGDNHLLAIGEYRGIMILTPAAFMVVLNGP